MDILTNKSERPVAQHRAGQEPGFEQDLKAVTDAQHHPAMVGKMLHRPHDRREPGDGPGPQIIAVRKSAWQDDCVQAIEGCLLVPDFPNLLAKNVGEHMHAVVIAVGAWKDDNSDVHLYLVLLRPLRSAISTTRGEGLPRLRASNEHRP